MPENVAPDEPAPPAPDSPKGKNKAARVRDSQRRSRARKRELVESLQTRIAEFERRGVQATLDMQQAARAVATENRRLRELLALHGVGDAEVDVFLQADGSARDEEQPVSTHSESLGGSVPTGSPHLGPPCQSSVDKVPPVAAASVVCGLGRVEEPAALYVRASAAHPRSVLETSCDDAAAILVQVCRHESEVSIRNALGCRGPGSCVVSNTKLLQLMDEAG